MRCWFTIFTKQQIKSCNSNMPNTEICESIMCCRQRHSLKYLVCVPSWKKTCTLSKGANFHSFAWFPSYCQNIGPPQQLWTLLIHRVSQKCWFMLWMMAQGVLSPLGGAWHVSAAPCSTFSCRDLYITCLQLTRYLYKRNPITKHILGEVQTCLLAFEIWGEDPEWL